MRNFTAQLVATASIWTNNAMAQLPRECFFVTEMHGPAKADESFLMSDLPKLMASYKPGMKLESVIGYQASSRADSLVTGLQVNFAGDKQSALQLPIVGVQQEEFAIEKADLTEDQPDRISILTNDLLGVCDVIIHHGDTTTHFTKDNRKCLLGLEGIRETTLLLPEETPLVGFHGTSNSEKLSSLGLILADTESPQCQKPLENPHLELYDGMSIFEASTEAESTISVREKSRATALEAILVFDSMIKAIENKLEVTHKIEELEQAMPLQIHPSEAITVDSLKKLMNRLTKIDLGKNATTKTELKQVFDQLSSIYAAEEDYYELPVKVAQLLTVYQQLQVTDSTYENSFQDRKPTDQADFIDLTILFDKLVEHYTEGNNPELNVKESKSLVEIFDSLKQFYETGRGQF